MLLRTPLLLYYVPILCLGGFMNLTAEEHLRNRIATTGPITFAEFMETALFWPLSGYYTRSLSNPANDFFTAPAAHPAFGALLSLQLEEMWYGLGEPPQFTVIEPGAGSGLLAQDILQYAQQLNPAFWQALRYICIERRNLQQSGYAGYTAPEWLRAKNLPVRGIVGCILSNELLDVFPVHRVTLKGGSLRELYVGFRAGRFESTVGALSHTALSSRLEEEGITLDEGQQVEICLYLEPWVREVAECLEKGFVLTIDYGHDAKTLYSPQRRNGSLRCYYQHTISSNPYVYVGSQDITSHVDFTGLVSLGKQLGLNPLGLKRQSEFLENLGLGILQKMLLERGPELNQQKRDANRMGMLEIARNGGMGEFKSLIQSKGIAQPKITGILGRSSAWEKRLRKLPLPLLREKHLPLMESKYPHTSTYSASKPT